MVEIFTCKEQVPLNPVQFTFGIVILKMFTVFKFNTVILVSNGTLKLVPPNIIWSIKKRGKRSAKCAKDSKKSRDSRDSNMIET